jgi:hypothetical protein
VEIKLDFDDYLTFNDEVDWNKHVEMLYGLTPRHEPYLPPDQFPCIALEAGVSINSRGPDQVHYAYLYDYTITGE